MTSHFRDLAHVAGCIRDCTKCPLSKTRRNAVPGEGAVGAQLMFVGEAPGQVNDELGRPFVGHGGRVFDKILERCGISRAEVFVTNAVKCWPPGNRAPKKAELTACHPYLDKQIEFVNPRCIVALGSTAFTQITGNPIKMREEHGKLSLHGRIWICPTFHPNGLRYIKGGMSTVINDICKVIERIDTVETQPASQGSLRL